MANKGTGAVRTSLSVKILGVFVKLAESHTILQFALCFTASSTISGRIFLSVMTGMVGRVVEDLQER